MDFYPLNRSPEQIQAESILRPGLIKDTCTGVGIFVVSVVSFGSFNMFDQQISRYESAKQQCVLSDVVFNTVLANTLNNPRFTSELMNETGAEIGVFQETQKDDIQEIVDQVPSSVGVFAPTDYPVEWEEGGQGNTTISVGLKSEENFRQFSTSPDVFKFIKATFSGNKQEMANAYKERRAALVSSFDVKISGVKVRLNIMNVHVAGGNVGINQTYNVLKFAEEEMNNDESIEVIYGDFNRTPKELKPSFDRMKNPWVISEIGPTSRDDGRQIDHVIYRPFVKVGDTVYKVKLDSKLLQKKGSDHRAVNTEFSLEEIDGPAFLSSFAKIQKILEKATHYMPKF